MTHYREALGLDIGSHSAKAVHAVRRFGVVRMKSANWVRLPRDIEERDRVLRSFIVGNGWEGLHAVVAVRGKSVMLHSVDVVPGDPRSLSELLSLEMDHFNGLVAERTVSDHMPYATAGRRYAFLAVGRLEDVETALAEAAAAGVDVVNAVPGATAAFLAVARLLPRMRRPVVCIDIGHGGTDVVIGLRRNLLFARRFFTGAGEFADNGDAAAWMAELKACLALYESQFGAPELAPERIVVAGGGALGANIKSRIAVETGVATTTLSELTDAGLPSGKPERYATAMGLALAGVRRGCGRPSLLPPATRERVALAWQRKYWLIAGMATLLAVLITTLATYADLGRKKRILERRRATLATMHALQRRAAMFQDMNATLKKQLAPYESAVRNARVLQTVIQAVAEAKHGDDWVTLIADSHSYYDARRGRPVAAADPATGRESGTASSPPYEFNQVVVEGYSPVDDLSTVRAMIESLRNTPGILDADLLGDDRVREDPARDARWLPTGCRLFAVEITLPTP